MWPSGRDFVATCGLVAVWRIQRGWSATVGEVQTALYAPEYDVEVAACDLAAWRIQWDLSATVVEAQKAWQPPGPDMEVAATVAAA